MDGRMMMTKNILPDRSGLSKWLIAAIIIVIIVIIIVILAIAYPNWFNGGGGGGGGGYSLRPMLMGFGT